MTQRMKNDLDKQILIVVRHAEPETSEMNSMLSEVGYNQADFMGDQIKGEIGDAPYKILSSPLNRAMQTAQLIRRHLTDKARMGENRVEDKKPLLELSGGAPLSREAIELIEEYVQPGVVLIIVTHEPYTARIPEHFGHICRPLKKGEAYLMDLAHPEDGIKHLEV